MRLYRKLRDTFFRIQRDISLNFSLALVQQHGSRRTIRIAEGCYLKLRAVTGTSDADCAGTDPAAELTDIIITALLFITAVSVQHKRRFTEIPDMVRASLFVKKQIPVDAGADAG